MNESDEVQPEFAGPAEESLHDRLEVVRATPPAGGLAITDAFGGRQLAVAAPGSDHRRLTLAVGARPVMLLVRPGRPMTSSSRRILRSRHRWVFPPGSSGAGAAVVFIVAVRLSASPRQVSRQRGSTG